MGIIAIGFGLGGPFGIFGALLHMLNHALAKSLLFFGGGNVFLKLKTKVMEDVRGLGQLMPATAALLFIGMLALAGSPPSGSSSANSVSCMQRSPRVSSWWQQSSCYLLIIIFPALIWHIGGMVFGKPADDVPRGEVNRTNIWVMIVLAAGLLS